MLTHLFSDELNLSSRNLLLELVVVLDANLLYTIQCAPTIFDNIIEFCPALVEVEFSCSRCADAPDLVEQVQDLQCWIVLCFFCGFDLAITVLPLDPQIRNLHIAPR